MLEDPITKELLRNPVLASDGETYSLESLQQAMAADPWHRSPMDPRITLRPQVFPNAVVRGLIPTHPESDKGLTLYDDRKLPPDARILSLDIPLRGMDAKTAMALRRFGLRTSVRVVMGLRRDEPTGQDWLVHPPCFVECAEDVLELARALGIHRLVANPECLGGARLPAMDTTIEQRWLYVRSTSSTP